MAGTLLRFWLTEALARRQGGAFPVGTFVVNVVGCFLAGFLFQLLQERAAVGETARAAVFVGLLGGFTTFSAYGLQSFALLREGNLWTAALYVFASNAAGLLMVWAGHASAKMF